MSKLINSAQNAAVFFKQGGIMDRKGINRQVLKANNDKKMLELIYKKAPITRSEVANQLNLTLPAITARAGELLNEGVLIEKLPDETAEKKLGRKAQYLAINPQSGYTVGVELGPYLTTVCIVDICGKVISEKEYPKMCEDYEKMIGLVASYISDIIDSVPKKKRKIYGVGIGVPGFVHNAQGIIRNSVWTEWVQKPIVEDLSKATGLSVAVDNNVRVRLVREDLLSREHRPGTFLYYFISYGIGCSMMINHETRFGISSGACEIGHMIIGFDPDEEKINQKELEDIGSEKAILAQIREAATKGQCAVLRKNADMNDLSMKDILVAQKAGDPDVIRIMDNACRSLGVGLANMVNFISPRLVIVDGYIMKNEENRIKLEEALDEYLFGLTRDEVRLEFPAFNRFSGALGAAALAIKRFFLDDAGLQQK